MLVTVVDAAGRAHPSGLFQFAVVAAGDESPRPQSHRPLQRESCRPPPMPGDQDGFARLRRGLGHQRPPGGQPGQGMAAACSQFRCAGLAKT